MSMIIVFSELIVDKRITTLKVLNESASRMLGTSGERYASIPLQYYGKVLRVREGA